MTLTAISSGLLIYLGVLLLVAAGAKARSTIALESALVAVFPHRCWTHEAVNPRRLARLALVAEAATGVVLLSVAISSPPRGVRLAAGAWAIFVFTTLLIASTRLAKRGKPCACFGSVSDPASARRPLRAWLFFTMAVAQLAASWLGPANASGPRSWGIYLAAVSAAAATAACASPRLSQRRGIASWRTRGHAEHPTPDGVPAESSVRDGPSAARGWTIRRGSSRRAFLIRGLGSIGAFIGLASLATPPALAGGGQRSCQDAFNLCYGCGFLLGEAQCCINCYVECQTTGGGGCTPGISCSGCWPGV